MSRISSNSPVPRNQDAHVVDRVISTPSYLSGLGWTAAASARIAATPDVCMRTVLKATEYGKWEEYIRQIEITEQPAEDSLGGAALLPCHGASYLRKGTKATVHPFLEETSKQSAPSPIEVTRAEAILVEGRKGWRLAWKSTASQWYFSEKVQEFVEDGQGGTDYVIWESFGGFLAPVIRLTTGKQIVRGMELTKNGLKARAEGKL